MKFVEKIERATMVLILLTIAGMAFGASFTHMKDWTMDNLPQGTSDYYGWTNAAISELIPLAAMLKIRQVRRQGGGIAYAVFLLVIAAALSLAAQLAVARPSITGWLLSAVPALAFMAISKLVLSGKVEEEPETAPEPVVVKVLTPEPIVPAQARPLSIVPPLALSPAPAPIPVAAARRESPRRVTAKVLTAEQVVKAFLAKHPGAGAKVIAQETGVSLSTVYRHLPKEADSSSPSEDVAAATRVNGHATDLVTAA